MKKNVLILFILIAFQSCIPIRIAPKIKDYQLTKGKRFKKSLPKRQMFVFEDPKEANEFYNYVNTKFKLEHIDVYDNIPFSLANKQFFFSFYEVDIPNKTIKYIVIWSMIVCILTPFLVPLYQSFFVVLKTNT